MVDYNLEHLTQPPEQYVLGPIQDDEALFLYALIRGMRLTTVLELGGLHGYSAQNFLRAVGPTGAVFTCDIWPPPALASNHIVLRKNANALEPSDFSCATLDLVFFDCHDYAASLAAFKNLRACGLITDSTVLALHDTNTHVQKFSESSYETAHGWVHQSAERALANFLTAEHGYHAFSLHTAPHRHSAELPFRHGITLLSKWRPLPL